MILAKRQIVSLKQPGKLFVSWPFVEYYLDFNSSHLLAADPIASDEFPMAKIKYWTLYCYLYCKCTHNWAKWRTLERPLWVVHFIRNWNDCSHMHTISIIYARRILGSSQQQSKYKYTQRNQRLCDVCLANGANNASVTSMADRQHLPYLCWICRHCLGNSYHWYCQTACQKGQSKHCVGQHIKSVVGSDNSEGVENRLNEMEALNLDAFQQNFYTNTNDECASQYDH